MIQPGVYFVLDAPFVRIIGLYSNVLEDPGVISSQGDRKSPVDDQQLKFLGDQLRQLKAANYKGAVIIAVHHPPFTSGVKHAASPRMLADLDAQCKAAGLYPHAVLSGHAHNYQRFTRKVGQSEIPYIVAGCGGHDIAKSNTPIRTPMQSSTMPGLTMDSYLEKLGYLRVVVTAKVLRIEFHSLDTGVNAKSPVDVCTVDLQRRILTTAQP